MKIISVENPGPDSRLVFAEMEPPEPGPDELLVRVHASALNRADLLQRMGAYPPPPGASPVLGLEMAGTVERVGANGGAWTPGDRVMGLLPGGGYAQYAVVHKDVAMRVPASFSFEQGAAIPEVFLTAYQALFLLGDLQDGETVLLHAGASGVGTAAIQMAQMAGARVLVTASAGKHAVCHALGAALCIDYKTGDFAPRALEFTGGKGVNLIVDVIGAPYFSRNVQLLQQDGRLILLAMMGGSSVPEVDLRALFRKRLQIKASTLRNRSLPYKAALSQTFVTRMLPLFESGMLKPVIDEVFEWQDVEQAHEKMKANANAGKIVLKVG